VSLLIKLLPGRLGELLKEYLDNEPAKLNARAAAAVVAVLAFVAIVFLDQDQETVIAAAVAAIGVLEVQGRATRERVVPVDKLIKNPGEAIAMGGPGGDPLLPPMSEEELLALSGDTTVFDEPVDEPEADEG